MLLFAIKYNLDRVVAGLAFHRSWYIFNYWIPGVNAQRGGIPKNDWPFFFLAVEGLFCLIMAAPLAVPLALMGGFAGYIIQKRRWHHNEVSHALCAVVLYIPLSLAAENDRALEPPLFEVRTAVEIQASRGRSLVEGSCIFRIAASPGLGLPHWRCIPGSRSY